MKLKILLCLALVLGGALLSSLGQGALLPRIEDVNDSFLNRSNKWVGHDFHEIMPPADVKDIILIENRNNFLRELSPQEVKDGYGELFNQLEQSSGTALGPYEADFEGSCAQFAVVTRSGHILSIEALSGMSFESISALLIHGHGFGARINVSKFKLSSATNEPVHMAKGPLPPVDTDYLLDQKPGDWNGKSFRQIASPGEIKRIVLLTETEDVFDYVPRKPDASDEEQNQTVYDKFFKDFGISTARAQAVSLSGNEYPIAGLFLTMDSGEIIYMQIIGTSGRFENGKVVGNHISGVLLHGHGKGVRIALNIPPVSEAR